MAPSFSRLAFMGLCFVVAAALLGPTGAARAAEDDPVVAIVNGAEIRRSDVARAHAGLPEQLRSYPLELIYPNLIQRMVDSRLVVNEGRRQNLQDDEAVKRRLAELEDQVIQDVYLTRYLEEAVDEAALRKRYESFVGENPPEEERQVRHILLESEADARAVIAELDGGAEFEALARERSTGPSAAQGGDIGFITYGDVVPAFADAAFALDAGGVTPEPVQTQFGWHVIKLEAVRQADPPSFEAARPELENALSRDAISGLIERLRADSTVELFNLDGSPMEKEEDAGDDADKATE